MPLFAPCKLTRLHQRARAPSRRQSIGAERKLTRRHQQPQPNASPAPGESPTAAQKPKRGRKKAEPNTAASPAAAASISPAAVCKAKAGGKNTKAEPKASPSPGKFSTGDLFKPKSSAATTPEAVRSAPAKNRSTEAAANPPAPGGGHGLVWVNSDSHIYHKEESRFYGTTKKGKYMTEAQAVKEGNRAAGKGE